MCYLVLWLSVLPPQPKTKKPPVRVVFLLLNCSTGFEPAKHKRKTDESMAVRQS